MTEGEAKTKWCPFARYGGIGDPAGVNRWKQMAPPDEPYAMNPVPCRCIGSDCMAWRWKTVSKETSEQMKALRMAPIENYLGYCGLAGQP